jgi:hypothetical protein
VMQSASQNLKDYDIEALANYMHGLYEKWKIKKSYLYVFLDMF